MNLLKRMFGKQAPAPVVVKPKPITPQPWERDLINKKFPDRSAGRWCAFCGQAGNHHTDRHELYLMAAKGENA